MSSFSASSTTNKVIEFADWNPKAHKYMAPKVNDKGGKSVTLISTQTNRSLHLNTPLLMTWGIADFMNDDATSDGKYKISLNFPNPEYKTESTDTFLRKVTEFQSQIIDDAVTNSELWFGKKKSRELVEDSFFPFLKFPKVKDATGKSTGTIDYSRPPSIPAKVPCYPQDDGTTRWECDLFNKNYDQIFPCDDGATPVDLVPKLSKIACTLQCTGIWVGGKGWGLTWKFISGVVIPKLTEIVRGKCHIKLNMTDVEQSTNDDEDVVEEQPSQKTQPLTIIKPETISTNVEDSDEDEPAGSAEESVPKTPPATVVEQSAPPKIVKKVVKKKVVA
jgi:hypothetical protein